MCGESIRLTKANNVESMSIYGSGHEGAAVLLPGFAIK